MASICAGCPGLERLSLSLPRAEAGLDELGPLTCLTRLRELDLRAVQLTAGAVGPQGTLRCIDRGS